VRARLADQRDGGLVHRDPLAREQIQKIAILPLAQPVHGLGARKILWSAIRQVNLSRGQEVADSRPARLAVDVGAIVGCDVERGERRGATRGVRNQVLVEELLPGRRVQLRRPCDDAIQIEQEGIERRQIDDRRHHYV
jgi:hypothetical protein